MKLLKIIRVTSTALARLVILEKIVRLTPAQVSHVKMVEHARFLTEVFIVNASEDILHLIASNPSAVKILVKTMVIVQSTLCQVLQTALAKMAFQEISVKTLIKLYKLI